MNDLIKSVSIDALLVARDGVLDRVKQIHALVSECDAILATIPELKMPASKTTTGEPYYNLLKMEEVARPQGDYRTCFLVPEKSNHIDNYESLRKNLDRNMWNYLMRESGMLALMDAAAKDAWRKQIDDGMQRGEFGARDNSVPELTRGTIAATFEQLHSSRGEMFERGVVNCFKNLSWDYKTNLPQKFGKRIVISNLMSSYRDCKFSELNDLERVMHILDGKPEPAHDNTARSKIAYKPPGLYDLDYMQVRTYKNLSGHVTFKRLELVDKMNLIIAKHYPGALPAPK